MPTVNIKRIVCKAVADYFATNVAGLAGKVSSVMPGPEQKTLFPSALVETSRFEFEPENPDDLSDELDTVAVIQVGEFQGMAELKVYATTPAEREQYEQRIMDLFIADPEAPGTLYIDTPPLTVNGQATLYSAQIKVRLESADWEEEYAFENRRYSFLDISFAYPALTTQTVANINSLQLALANLTDDPDETIEVQEDGSIEPVTP